MNPQEIKEESAVNQVPVNLKIILYAIFGIVGAVLCGYKVGYNNCEKKFKPVAEDITTRIKKLEKRASI